MSTGSTSLLRQVPVFLGHRTLLRALAWPSHPAIFQRKSSTSEQYIIQSKCPPVSIEKQHFADFVWKDAVETYGSRTALVNGHTGDSYTFLEGRRQCDLVASALADEATLRKGDVLAIFMPNNPEYVFAYTATTEIGATVTTINPMYTASELAKQLEMSSAKMVLTLKDFLPKVEEALGRIKGGDSIKVIVVDANDHSANGRILSYHKLLNEASGSFQRAEFDFDDIICLPYSSGTTGVPKGVMLSHKNIVVNGRQIVYSPGIDGFKLPTDTYQPSTLGVLPIFHIYGSVVTAFCSLHIGGKVVTLSKFEPKSFIEALSKYKPNFMHFAPPLVGFCGTHPDVKPEHLESLEYVVVGAAPVGESLINLFKKRAPKCIFKEAWGMTELSPVGIMSPSDDFVPGSCGLALPNTELKIIDVDSGEALPPHSEGELCVRGPQVMRGYLNNPEATKNTITDDGWLKTGDIAFYDDTHHIYIVDRLKELIKVKGFQVPPAELENLIRSHEKVLDVAVIGIPHDMHGEVPRAYIVKKDQTLTEQEMEDFVHGEVSEYKRLRGGIEFLDAIPKSPSGKILRRELVATWKATNMMKQ